MNKNVFNYLNDKAHDAIDYIRAKAEAAGAYLEDHASDIKDGLVKGTATVLTVASLLGGMTGCGDLGFDSDNYQQKFPISTIKPIDDIEEQGITAQDVLAAYDTIALTALQKIMEPAKDDFGSRWNCFSAQFNSITNNNLNIETENGEDKSVPHPISIPNDSYSPQHLWSQEDMRFYDDVYLFNFSYSGDITNQIVDRTVFEMAMTWEDFSNIMKAFNIQPFELTQEYIDSLPYSSSRYEYCIGEQVYPEFKLDRETILNASEEQLWALYNAATNSIANINFTEPIFTNNESYLGK